MTYSLRLANPTLTLQSNRPAAVAAHLVRSDGIDVTAFATGWEWNVDNRAAIRLTFAGEMATLTALNTSRTTAQGATVTVSARAPDGTVLTGQIAATALPSYAYNVVLSLSNAVVAGDLPVTVKAKIMRSDGVDVTADFHGWNWSTPSSAGGANLLSVSTSSGGTQVTIASTLTTCPLTAPGIYQNLFSVTAAGPDPLTSASSATVLVTQAATYSFAFRPLAAPDLGIAATLHAQIFHDGKTSEDVTALCSSWTWALTGAIAVTANSADLAFVPTASTFSATPICMIDGLTVTGPAYTGSTTPMTISAMTVTPTSPTTATLQWNTNHPATTQGRYIDTFIGEDFNTAVDSTLATTHTVFLTGLTPGDLYRVEGISVTPSVR
ncbi:fibronectin type III domain-containing protein [Cupriavidus basilensis]|uniref:Fibronectin type III domain-containing protein n=1 Tax=Cupriavidus basilensis TaxID=68895 RepID=A0ABT6ARV7_9BURK|nr:fibronectin type III domain-containing protein [Cupriavidus basilensis]MDF3835194.1 fibronectin type III domain-containing protein [Cupriavidus basilensis]